MHELFLCAEVKADQLQSALSILQGYCAMPPTHLIQRRLIYKGPKRSQGAPLLGMSKERIMAHPPTAPQRRLWQEVHHYLNQQAYIITISYNVAFNDFQSIKFFGTKPEDDADLNTIPGSLLFNEMPEPTGARPVSSRKTVLINDEKGLPSAMTGNPHGFGYSFVNEHVAEVYRFINDDTTFTIYRCLLHPDDEALVGRPSATGSPRLNLPPIESLKPFDQANGWIMNASLKVEDGTKPADMQLATDILMKIKADLAGSFDLIAPDRFSLDTRA